MIKPSDSQIFVAIEVGINVRVWVGPDCGPNMPTSTPTWVAQQGLNRTVPVRSYAESTEAGITHINDMVDRVSLFLQSQAVEKL